MSALAFDDAALDGLAPSLGLSGASDIDTALLSDIDGASRRGRDGAWPGLGAWPGPDRGITGARCTRGLWARCGSGARYMTGTGLWHGRDRAGGKPGSVHGRGLGTVRYRLLERGRDVSGGISGAWGTTGTGLGV